MATTSALTLHFAVQVYIVMARKKDERNTNTAAIRVGSLAEKQTNDDQAAGEHARYGSMMVAGPTRASFGPRSSRCGMLIDVELDPVVSPVSRTYLELVDAAMPVFQRTDDTAAPSQ